MEQESVPQKVPNAPEEEILREAQEYITREIQRQTTGRIGALSWEQTPNDRAARIHRLVLFQGGEKTIFTFTEYELRENYGSEQWERRLREDVSNILAAI
jgi:hypothetical protein